MTPARAFLGIFRLLIGLGAWFAPDTTVKLFGIDPERSDRFIGRLFGSREFTLAAARRGNMSTQAILLGPVGVTLFAALGFFVAREAAAGAGAES